MNFHRRLRPSGVPRLAFGLLALLLAAGTTRAHADAYIPLPETTGGLSRSPPRYYSLPSEPAPLLDRRGFVFQVALGAGGVFGEDDGRLGLGWGLAAGGVLAPNLAALFDYSALTYTPAAAGGAGDVQRASHAIFGGVLQLFFGDVVWLKAGAGVGQLSFANPYGLAFSATERALAGIFGLGVEVHRLAPDFAVDLQLRAAGGHYTQVGWLVDGAVMIGVNGY